jgi:single-strand DNA-binding protein
MAGGFNKAILIGNVGRDPEVKEGAGGRVAIFSLATSTYNKDKSGERNDLTDWHHCVVFNEHLIKLVEQYVKKGSKLYVEGLIRTRSYDDKEGIKRYRTEIVLGFSGRLEMLDRREGSGGASESSYGAKQDFDDSIPF